MQCPDCYATDEHCFAVACWVFCDTGEAAEACGDGSAALSDERRQHPTRACDVPPEPPQVACCNNCGNTFGPKPGHVFRVIRGRPQEVEL